MSEHEHKRIMGISSRGRKRIKIFLPVFVVIQGLIILLLMFFLAILLASGDPIDNATAARGLADSISIWIALFGAIYLLGSIFSSFAFLRSYAWSKYLILVLLLIGSGLSGIAIAGIGYLSPVACIFGMMILTINILAIVLAFRYFTGWE